LPSISCTSLGISKSTSPLPPLRRRAKTTFVRRAGPRQARHEPFAWIRRSLVVTSRGIAIRRLAALAAASVGLAVLPACGKSDSTRRSAPTTTTTSPATWPMYHGDLLHSGLAHDGPPPGSAHQQWTSPALDGLIYAAPVLGHGM